MKNSQESIRKHPRSVSHAFHISKEEERELQITDGLGSDNVYPITEMYSTPKWYCIHNSKYHDTVECKVYLQRSSTPQSASTAEMST